MLRPSRPEQFWIGVEAFEPYVDQYDLAKRYDQVMVLDIRHWNYSKEGIDCVIFGDVLEHMTRAEAMNCVMNALQWARDVFISVPVGHVPQGAVNGNEFERHRHDWDSAAFCTAFSRNIDDAVLEHDPLMRNILMGAYHLKAR